MIFELLRTYKVDVMRYLPKFLAKDKSFNAVQGTLSYEHEQYRLKVIDIAKQFFVETATWGLADWERVYALPSTGTIENRRIALLRKIRARDTVTNNRMQSLIDSVVFTKDATLVENVAPGVFRIDMETMIVLDELRAIVDFYKPAHLTYLIAHAFFTQGQFFYAGAVSDFDILSIEKGADGDIDTGRAPVAYAGSVSVFDNVFIGGNHESI